MEWVSIAVRRHEATLCKLAIADDAYLNQLLFDHRENLITSELQPKAHALVRLGALIAIDPPIRLRTCARSSQPDALGCPMTNSLAACSRSCPPSV
jgi:hypothetical protein